MKRNCLFLCHIKCTKLTQVENYVTQIVGAIAVPAAGHNRSKLFQGEFLSTSVAIDKTLLKEIAKYRTN